MTFTTFTLDPDYLTIAAQDGTEAEFVRQLAAYHAQGRADVAIVALAPVDAAGRPTGSFREALESLGLSHLKACPPLCDADADIYDSCVPSSEEALQLQSRIHQILFPNRAFGLQEARRRHAVEGDSVKFRRKWIESRRSVQTVWSHLDSGRQILVTSNQNFYKRKKMPNLLGLGISAIERPDTALRRVRSEP